MVFRNIYKKCTSPWIVPYCFASKNRKLEKLANAHLIVRVVISLFTDTSQQKQKKIRIVFHPIPELKIASIFAKQAGWIFRTLVLHFCFFRRKSGKLESCFYRQEEWLNDLLVVGLDFLHGATLKILVTVASFSYSQTCAETTKRVNLPKKVLAVVASKNKDRSVYRNCRRHINWFRIQWRLYASSRRAFFNCPQRTLLIFKLFKEA